MGSPFRFASSSADNGSSSDRSGCTVLLIILAVGLAVLTVATGLFLEFFVLDDADTDSSDNGFMLAPAPGITLVAVVLNSIATGVPGFVGPASEDEENPAESPRRCLAASVSAFVRVLDNCKSEPYSTTYVRYV